jgi:hypothetical protein
MKKDEMDGKRTTHGEIRNTYKIVVWKREGKRQLERVERRWEDIIWMDLRETGVEHVD